MNETQKNVPSGSLIRPRYACCHPNTKGTGTCVKFELHPAHDFVEGSVFVTFAMQKTVGCCGDGMMIPSTFDWENAITVRLTINEVAEMLEVFRGYRERLVDGKGFFHTCDGANTIITLEHRLDPAPGYLFGVSRKRNGGEPRRMCILLEMKEVIVLSEALASSMLYMAFGIPKVIDRPEKRSRNGYARERVAKEVA